MAGPAGMVESVTLLARMNLLQIHAIFRSLFEKPACGTCSTVSPNAMIGRGWELAGKSSHAARAAVGGLGGVSPGSPCPLTAPQAVRHRASAHAATRSAMFT